MIDQKIPRTDAELDALFAATASAEIRRASRSLMRTLADEIELRDARRNQSRGYLLILEAVMNGVDLVSLPDHFEQEESASRQRTKDLLALLDETENRLKARREVVQSGDGKLSALLVAIDHAQSASARAVREQSADVEYVKSRRLAEAATAAGIDPSDLAKLRTPKLDPEAENLRRHRMSAAIGPLRSVLEDLHRRTDSLPAWVLETLAKMGPCPASGAASVTRDNYLRTAVALVNEAIQ